MAYDRKAKLAARNYADRADRVAFEIGYGFGFDCYVPKDWCSINEIKNINIKAYCDGFMEGSKDGE